jgi:hypothetical protein
MIVLKKRTFGLLATQKWFFTKINFSDSLKITVYKQLDFSIKSKGLFVEKDSYTLHSDLSLTNDEILTKFSSTIRNEIKRSEREGCVFNSSESKENFIIIYNDFASQREITGLTMEKLKAINSNLIITSCTINGIIATVHSYLVDSNSKRVRLLHSGTQRFSEGVDRNMIARSNKFLHFKDMVKFKEEGFLIYDWGGIAYNSEDKGLQGINNFKESFGGELIKEKELLSLLYFLILKIFKS